MAMRPKSSSQISSTHGKLKLSTKYKYRTGNSGILNESDGSIYNKNKYDFENIPGKRSLSNKFPEDESFQQTSKILEENNFSHHHPELCVCDDCSCGRHLCKMHQIKPDLTKSSVYQKDFYKKSPVENKINISTEYDRLQGPNLQISSIYLKDFPGNQGDDVSRPHPEDLLKNRGPSQNLTSYSSGFPGYRCENQYVKPTDQHTRGRFPLKGKSTYSRSFVGEPRKRDDRYSIPNNLKIGNSWFGKTTYGTKFLKPSHKNYPSHFKKTEKIEINPNFKHQYETTYRSNYLGEKKEVCPSKTKLQLKIKGHFTNSKARFSQNTDFKSLSPEFHAISTSKHSYV